MAVAGIIAEYNPFHRGHAWQIAALRERLGPDTAVVAVMSGNFVQRGDFALLRKHARAEMALSGGADLVLELPAPWSSAAAERFAQGGVALLAAYLVEQKGESLEDYLNNKVFAGNSGERMAPDARDVEGFAGFMDRYQKGLAAQRGAVDNLL